MIITQEMLYDMYNEINILKSKVIELEKDKYMFLSEFGKLNTNVKEINHILKDDFYVEVFKNDWYVYK